MYNWLILIGAIAVMIFVGYISNQHSKTTDSNASFLVGNNKIGVFVGALSILATGFSGWGFVGSPGVAYQFGSIEVLGNLMFAPAIVIGTYFSMMLLQKRAKEMNGYTIPEFIANSHEGSKFLKKTIHLIAALATIVFLNVYLMGQIKAVSLLASTWLKISPVVAAIVLMLVLVLFTAQGGLLAVARTDMIMCLGMLASALIIAWVIFQDVSLGEMISSLNQQNPILVNPTSSNPYGGKKYSVYLIFCYAFLFTTTLPYMSSRFLSFKGDLKPHRLVPIMVLGSLILSIVPLVGLYLRMKSPSLLDADKAMLLFLEYFMPEHLAGLINLFILFAMLSTISSVLHSVASSLAYDIRKALGWRMSHSSIWNTGAVVVSAVVGIIMSFNSPPMMLNQIAIIGTGGLISLLAGPIFVRFFLPSTAVAAFVSMILGLSANIFSIYIIKSGWVEAPIIGALVGGLTYIIVGKITIMIKKSEMMKENKIKVIIDENRG
ncbi:MAG: sodium:solute symporter family protein [Brevinema sp.]